MVSLPHTQREDPIPSRAWEVLIPYMANGLGLRLRWFEFGFALPVAFRVHFSTMKVE